jgi:peptidyl-prolyl cis-trans isomerase A (cyclophilin A)
MLVRFFTSGVRMRKHVVFILVVLSSQLIGQATSAKPATKPATKPAGTAPAGPPTAIIDTTAGKLTCILFPEKAPIGVANFVGLGRGTKDWTDPKTGKKMHGVPLYNGTIFHRIIPEFMIQGGDPLGDGTGDPGYKFKNETTPLLTFDRPGRLAYANAGPDTNGSQFFITEVPYPSLDGKYTLFGQCDDASVELVKKIARMPRGANDRPDVPVTINKITFLHVAGTATRRPTTTHKLAPKPATPQGTKQQ